jgi:serine protease Do
MSKFLLLVAVFPLLAQQASIKRSAMPVDAFSRSVQDLTSRITPSVVRIRVTKYGVQGASGRTDIVMGKEQSIGSGVIIDATGYILTNAHVVDGAQKVKVDLVEGAERDVPGVLARAYSAPQNATIIGVFKEGDIALLKIEKTGLPALPFADYSALHQGQVVFAFGSPSGLQNSVSMGIVSSIARQPDPDSPFLYVQTDTPINPGNSGGPLVNTAGEIVGINTFIFSQSGGSEGVGFAIPSPLLKWVSENLRKYGHVHRSNIGVGLQGITPVLAAALKLPRESGVVVSDIVPGGPAELAGMKLDDVLLAVNNRPVDSVPAMLGFFFEHGAGEHVRFDILRGDERLALDVVTAESAHQADHLADIVDPAKDVIPGLGVLGVTVDKQVEDLIGTLRLSSGVVVAGRVQTASPTETGLQTDDVIHAFNGTLIFDLDALKAAVANLKAGDPVAVLVERHGQLSYVSFEFPG